MCRVAYHSQGIFAPTALEREEHLSWKLHPALISSRYRSRRGIPLARVDDTVF
jgi:hypothetical protein